MSTATLVDPTEIDWCDDDASDVTVWRAGSDEDDFDLIADDLQEFALGQGSLGEVARNSNYTEILAMGDRAITPLLHRLETGVCRPVWLRLLSDITGLNVYLGTGSVSEAADAWLTLGRRTSSFARFVR